MTLSAGFYLILWFEVSGGNLGEMKETLTEGVAAIYTLPRFAGRYPPHAAANHFLPR